MKSKLIEFWLVQISEYLFVEVIAALFISLLNGKGELYKVILG